ncbi:MAG: hypothetical protein HY795_14530 [Desulfovibrio sp.]|nr:hypothetical protein [Desulfovibrio sp.]MBI4961050.1 hypothetical protein [Desulfovibrio sp.]
MRSGIGSAHFLSSVFVCVLFSLLFSDPAVVYGDSAEPKRVLIVQSYNPEYVWCQNINQGIRDGLQGLNIAYETYYLDAKRVPDPKKLTEKGDEIGRKIERFAPDVVIAADDAAQEYVVVPFLKNKQRPQVVFCGVNAPPAKYGFPTSNVSGIRERWHYREAFALLKKLMPEVKSVAFFVDASESGGYVVNDLKEDLAANGPYSLEVVAADTVRTFQQWQQMVLKYQTAADSLAMGLYQTLIDERTGKVASPDEVMAWVDSVNKLPTIGFSDIAIEHGLMCGVLEAGHEQGYLAGAMAREVLGNGLKAGELPMRINDKGVILVNLKMAERLHVNIPYEIIEAAGAVIK